VLNARARAPASSWPRRTRSDHLALLFAFFWPNRVQLTADYFGPLPNLAARVMASAKYGQTLIEPSRELHVNWDQPSPLRLHGTDGSTDSIQISVLGKFSLKGVPTDTVLAQAMPLSLLGRTFESPSGRVSDATEIPLASVSAQGAGGTPTKVPWHTSAATPHTPGQTASPSGSGVPNTPIARLQRTGSVVAANFSQAKPRLSRMMSKTLPGAAARRASLGNILVATTSATMPVAATGSTVAVPELKLPGPGTPGGRWKNKWREEAICEVHEQEEAAGTSSVLFDGYPSSSTGHGYTSASRPAYPAAPELRKLKPRRSPNFEVAESDEPKHERNGGRSDLAPCDSAERDERKAEPDETPEPSTGGSTLVQAAHDGEEASASEWALAQSLAAPIPSAVAPLSEDGVSTLLPYRTNLTAGQRSLLDDQSLGIWA
jgi:hypothetical protein